MEAKESKIHTAIPCLICGESIPLTEVEEKMFLSSVPHPEIRIKVCDKCKKAVLDIRSTMDEEVSKS